MFNKPKIWHDNGIGINDKKRGVVNASLIYVTIELINRFIDVLLFQLMPRVFYPLYNA